MAKNYKKKKNTAADILAGSEQSIFLTGGAGVGKSTAINTFKENTKEKIIVIAPTGKAAINVGGSTIHSQLQLPPTLLTNKSLIKPMHYNSPKRLALVNADVILIDEISMVRADLFDAIDISIRINTGIDLPFGGKKVRMVGDQYQLAPVVNREDGEILSQFYDSPYFFDSNAFKESFTKVEELTKVHRQTDKTLIDALNAVRIGSHTKAHLDFFNQRHSNHLSEGVVRLTATNDRASTINDEELKKLPGEVVCFNAKIEGVMKESEYPADQRLCLKEGATILFNKNDINKRFVNGSIGIIYSVSRDSLIVRLESGDLINVEPVTWNKIVYKSEKNGNISQETVASFTQFPIKLGWALTIHKSQGSTLSRAHIDLGFGAFASGQLYVALSRVKSIEGLTLEKPIQDADIKVDQRVINFYNQIK